jgi:hypothetical protein
MPIEFNCQTCQRLVRTPDNTAGKKGKCPYCGSMMDIPRAAAAPPASEQAPRAEVSPASVVVTGDKLEFPCPQCGRPMRTPASAAGKKGKCAGCGTLVEIPALAKPAVDTAPARDQSPAKDKPVAKGPSAKPDQPAASAKPTAPVKEQPAPVAKPTAAARIQPSAPPPPPWLRWSCPAPIVSGRSVSRRRPLEKRAAVPVAAGCSIFRRPGPPARSQDLANRHPA